MMPPPLPPPNTHTRTVWTAGDFEEFSAVHSPTIGLPVSPLTSKFGLTTRTADILCNGARAIGERWGEGGGGKQTHLTNQTLDFVFLSIYFHCGTFILKNECTVYLFRSCFRIG